ncbi:MAG: Eco57I restriction-modification methylase domain-containing protein, partial [Dysgonamonadaceae bacterium]|nr:Eco57I restriction-modification methylase domain-containing protein [Dysgonamonadaceae bacterium]
KEDCFVFDFAPDRTLKVIAETAKISAKAGKTSGSDRQTMTEFLNFCPIIAVDGSQMITYNVDGMLEQLKKVYIERVVRNGFEDGYLYNNDQLMKLDTIELNDFEKLKGIIGNTKAMPKSGDIDINKQGFTDEQYEHLENAEKKNRSRKELTEEEKNLLNEKKEKKKNRDSAISILRGISIRMPLLIYGADGNDEDKEITIDNFADLIDQQSWEEFMPKGVTKEIFNSFKKYYEPDVFRAAGKRIRTMARAADQLSVEERIERITTIFNTFRNPDKETVLTPWRVVNMHLGDCIGGFVFYDEKMEKTLEQPRFVDHGQVTKDVFAPDSLILEINSKSGLYPLYMAYSIYRSRLSKDDSIDLNQNLSVENQLSVWDSVVAENIFVICKTPMAKSITKRTLVGFREAKVNTHHFEDLINQITNKPTKFIEKIQKGKTYWKSNYNNNMKFNAIVGNPPYQTMDGGAGASAKPIYNHFVNIAKQCNPQYISMITPSRWFAGGKGLDDFRETMLNDYRISKIIDFTNAKDCFPNTSISGGINFFLWNSKNEEEECEFIHIHDGSKETMKRKLNEFSVFIRYNKAVSIINKINDFKEEKISFIVSSRNPFSISSNTRGHKKIIDDGIILHSSDGKSYIRKSEINNENPYLKSYKIMVSKVTSEHAGEPDKNGMFRVLSRTEILNPNEVCTDSYLIIGKFSQRENVIALYSYLKTKFVRFLLLQAITSINLSKEKFQFVPLQNFTSNSDIDWNKSVDEIDHQLYSKYDLTDDEVTFIQSMIKPMD